MNFGFSRYRWVKWSVIAFFSLIVLFFAFYGSIYWGAFGKLPTTDDLKEIQQAQASLVYSKDSVLLGKYYIQDRQQIHFEEIPSVLKEALIATEDARFYRHNGIDERSLLRVFFKSILMGNKSSGGGSTLTLQLAKNLYGRKHYAFLSLVINKLRESFVARRIESVYTKDQILTLYLNTVSFSGNTYGIESASKKFFGIPAKALNIQQAATLVGTLKANHLYNPRLFPKRSTSRRNVVFQQMVKYGDLTQKEADSLQKLRLDLDFHRYSSGKGIAPFFREKVRREAKEILAQGHFLKPDSSQYELQKDGLRIYTTLDAGLQKEAHAAMVSHLTQLQKQFERSFGKNPPWERKKQWIDRYIRRSDRFKKLVRKGLSAEEALQKMSTPRKMELFSWEGPKIVRKSPIDSLRYYLKFLNTGSVAIDPHNGGVRAYIGGIDYQYFQFDHVRQSRREVGSTFKPFVYAAALEKGLKPCDYIPGKAVTYTDLEDWTPKNAEKEEEEGLQYSVAAALKRSLNTVAVKVLRYAGIQKVRELAKKAGINEDVGAHPSMALGTSSLSVLDLARGYTSFINGGRPAQLHFINKIEDRNGNVIYRYKPESVQDKPAFSEDTRWALLQMLRAVVNSGTGSRLRYRFGLKNDIAGKTGTTQNNADGWFVGMLPDLVMVTWVGNDHHQIKFRSTAMGQGANSALPIFGGLIQRLNKNPKFNSLTRAHFKIPSDIILRENCEDSRTPGFFERILNTYPDEVAFYGDSKIIAKDSKTLTKSAQRKLRREVRKKRRAERRKKRKKKGFFRRLFGG